MPEKGKRDKEAVAGPTPAADPSSRTHHAGVPLAALPSQPQTKCIKNGKGKIMHRAMARRNKKIKGAQKRGNDFFIMQCNKQKSPPLGPVQSRRTSSNQRCLTTT